MFLLSILKGEVSGKNILPWPKVLSTPIFFNIFLKVIIGYKYWNENNYKFSVITNINVITAYIKKIEKEKSIFN